jgi:hypothetical protein
MKKFISLCLLTILLVCASCGVGAEKKQEEISQAPIVTETPTPLPTPTEKGLATPNWKTYEPKIFPNDEPIGKTNFGNFTYPLPRGWQNAEEKEITLNNGKHPFEKDSVGFFLKEVNFGDLNSDNKAEAIVTLGVITGGLTNHNIIYILQGDNPKVIWHFETGDRSDGGLKDVKAENGELYVELFSKDRYIFQQKETQEVEDDMRIPPCCPKFFTISRYKWNGKVFVIQGKWESLPYESPK